MSRGRKWQYGAKQLAALREMRNVLAPRFRTSEPFIPYVGPEYGSSAARILIVGKATEGDWSCDKDEDSYDFQEHAERFVLDTVAEGHYRSAFWRFIVALVPEVHRTLGLAASDGDRRWSLERFAWSNFFKLGKASRGAPTGAFAAWQMTLAQELLMFELVELKPTAIVATVGNSYWKYMLEFFGDGGWEKEGPPRGSNLWVKTFLGSRVYWMRHPQGGNAGLLTDIRGFIARDQARWMAISSSE